MHTLTLIINSIDLLAIALVIAYVGYLLIFNCIGWLVRMGWWFPKTVARTLAENQARREKEMAELDKIIESRS